MMLIDRMWNWTLPDALRITAAIAFSVLIPTSLGAQSPQTVSVISDDTLLSNALPPGEWSRLQTSVDKGLQWLADNQEKDGRFPSVDLAQPAVTSLGVMAFLSRGHLPDQGPFGETITRAIDFVLSTQHRAGYFSLLPISQSTEHHSPAQALNYNHAIAGLMLGEVYGMTTGQRSRQIESALGRALSYHRGVQTRVKKEDVDIGGWRYGFPDSPNASSDMSVTGWALMFYRSAKNAEFNIPQQYFDQGLDFVERCYEPDLAEHTRGVFRYRPPEAQEKGHISLANTSSAMLTLILGGRHRHEGIAMGVRWFERNEYPRPWQNNYFFLTSYYTSQALAQVGGESWNRVFPQVGSKRYGSSGGNRGLATGQFKRIHVWVGLRDFAGGTRADTGLPDVADLPTLTAPTLTAPS